MTDTPHDAARPSAAENFTHGPGIEAPVIIGRTIRIDPSVEMAVSVRPPAARPPRKISLMERLRSMGR